MARDQKVPIETKPEVYMIGHTVIDWPELLRFLRSIGVFEWQPSSDATDAEKLVEFYGRLCYRSFEPGLNPNVTKIRPDTPAYIANILSVKHGSVLEHASVNFVFNDVSRVFTHELVRHRIGVGISQESLRYVRLDEGISMFIPEVIRENPKAYTWAVEHIQVLSGWQKELKDLLITDGMNFEKKKLATSAMRRFMGDGVATKIGWTCNIRALRHIIALRTDPAAEEEIRYVFDLVARKAVAKYPLFFGDFSRQENGAWVPKFEKV